MQYELDLLTDENEVTVPLVIVRQGDRFGFQLKLFGLKTDFDAESVLDGLDCFF